MVLQVVMLVWALVTFPLTIFGSMRGRAYGAAHPYEAPVKTNRAPRDIPRLPVYSRAPAQLLFAGLLPFSAIYIQVHCVFSAVWGHQVASRASVTAISRSRLFSQVYTLFGVLLLAFIMLLIVTAFVSVALIYFQLAAEVRPVVTLFRLY